MLFTGLDRGVEGGEEQSYTRSLPLDEALRGEVLLAYDVNGTPLPPQHGFPLRLVVPGWYGMTSVKWLARISLLDTRFDHWALPGADVLDLDGVDVNPAYLMATRRKASGGNGADISQAARHHRCGDQHPADAGRQGRYHSERH